MARPRIPEYEQFTVRISKEALAKFKAMAVKEHRSVNAQVAYAAEKWLEHEQQQDRRREATPA